MTPKTELEWGNSEQGYMPDQAELIYKTNFNRAWGDAAGDYWVEKESEYVDCAHQCAISEVEKFYCKTEAGRWVKRC